MYFCPVEVYNDWASNPVRGMTESEYLDWCNFSFVGHVDNANEGLCKKSLIIVDKDNNKLITYTEFVNLWVGVVRFFFKEGPKGFKY